MRGIRGERIMVRKVGQWFIYATPSSGGDVILEATLDGEIRQDWTAKMTKNGGVIAQPLEKALAKAEAWVAEQAQGEERAAVMLRAELKRISMEG